MQITILLVVGELVGTCHLHCYLGVVLYSILVIGLDGVSVTYGSLSLCLWVDCSVAPLPDYDHLYQVLSVCVREYLHVHTLLYTSSFSFLSSLSLSLFSLPLSFIILLAWIIYSPWSSKNLIDRNQLKKFMQVGIDVKCKHTNFGGRGFFGFGDMATSQKRPNFPFGTWTIVHGHRKI